MVKSNFDDLGVIAKLETRATTFMSGVWGHVIEKVVEKLGFRKNPAPNFSWKVMFYTIIPHKILK
jgi:hypothetical protein